MKRILRKQVKDGQWFSHSDSISANRWLAVSEKQAILMVSLGVWTDTANLLPRSNARPLCLDKRNDLTWTKDDAWCYLARRGG